MSTLMPMPSGEQVSLEFYFGRGRRGADVMRDVTLHCLRYNGRFTGDAVAYVGQDLRENGPTASHCRVETRTELSVSQLVEMLDDRDKRVAKVAIDGAIGLEASRPEVVSAGRVSPEASGHDSEPVSIVAEGWKFSTPGYEEEAIAYGARCSQRFLQICECLLPEYAAILNEDTLPCRYDMRQSQFERCFANFYVSRASYGTDVIDQLIAMYDDAHHRQTPNGVYISTWGPFNEEQRTIDSSIAFIRSQRVVELLA